MCGVDGQPVLAPCGPSLLHAHSHSALPTPLSLSDRGGWGFFINGIVLPWIQGAPEKRAFSACVQTTVNVCHTVDTLILSLWPTWYSGIITAPTLKTLAAKGEGDLAISECGCKRFSRKDNSLLALSSRINWMSAPSLGTESLVLGWVPLGVHFCSLLAKCPQAL